MRSFRDRPLARTVPFFLSGIWYGIATKVGWPIPALIFLTGFIGLLTRIPARYVWLPYGYRWLIGLAVYGSLFSAGVLIGSLNDERLSYNHISRRKHDAFTGIIMESPKRKGNSLRTTVRVDALHSGTAWQPAVGNVLVYLPAADSTRLLVTGERIYVNRPCEPVADATLPGQFDFKYWLELKQVYGTVRLRQGEWLILDLPVASTFMSVLESWQQRLVGVYRAAGFSGNELGVVSALVLGDDGEVEPELIHAFAASGTLHVLSVSGMHVALVHGAVERLLVLLFRRKRNRWPKFTVSLFVLWAYALLTGFSPAVRRAAAMLSLILLGKTTGRSVDTWNLLSGSLLILVAAQPGLLCESGFQLSYAAVAGIVGFYPWLRSRIGEAGRAGELLLTSVSVALAAQWFTFTLGLYYFHRFPNYFLPANLIIIPWSTVLLFGGIILLMLYPFPLLFQAFGQILEKSTIWLNKTVLLFNRLPNAEASGIWISGWECVLLTAAVLLLTVFLVVRSNAYLFAALFSLLVFFGSQ
ncbi:MAG: hypothetical protein RL021_218, partial [Bacteroidota bacterium]